MWGGVKQILINLSKYANILFFTSFKIPRPFYSLFQCVDKLTDCRETSEARLENVPSQEFSTLK